MKIPVGKVLKAQGIKGEIKISCFLDTPSMLAGVKFLYLGNNAHRVKSVRVSDQYCYVQLEDVTDRNTAENYKDWDVYADKYDIKLPPEKFFLSDVIGCTVKLNSGNKLGSVADVLQYGAADVYVVTNANSRVMFPFLKDLVISIDIESKTIVLDKLRFEQVAVYDDED
ncbi:MAG: ribosome maturation factor RimM [Corallococcus sp.]|nr:ribosome maturation factor RimM [Corallococcus sp.]